MKLCKCLMIIPVACIAACTLPKNDTVMDNSSKIRESSSAISENTRAVTATTAAMNSDMVPKMEALTLKMVELLEPMRALASVTGGANGKFPVLLLLAGATVWVLLTAGGVALGIRLAGYSKAKGSRSLTQISPSPIPVS